jgi:hypothetical protein
LKLPFIQHQFEKASIGSAVCERTVYFIRKKINIPACKLIPRGVNIRNANVYIYIQKLSSTKFLNAEISIIQFLGLRSVADSCYLA